MEAEKSSRLWSLIVTSACSEEGCSWLSFHWSCCSFPGRTQGKWNKRDRDSFSEGLLLKLPNILNGRDNAIMTFPVRTACLDSYQHRPSCFLSSSTCIFPLPLNCFEVSFKPSLLLAHAATSRIHRQAPQMLEPSVLNGAYWKPVQSPLVDLQSHFDF